MRPLLVALRPLGLGDLLTAVPALRALDDAFPGHRRVLATSPAMVPLACRVGWEAHPAVALAALDPVLHGADVAVDLHGRGPASQRVLLATGPRRLVSFAHAQVPGTERGAPWRPDEHEVARWCRMLAHAGIPADPRRLDLDAAPDPASPAAGAVVVHPGAAAPSRQWPPGRYAAVAAAAEAAGLRVVVTGSPAEAGLAASVAAAAGLPEGRVLAGTTDLPGLLTLVASARAVVSGDTGISHVATAVGTPSVVLCGPVPPSEWGPPPDRPRHRALWAGRRGDPHGTTVDPGLLELGVGDVLSALGEVAGLAGAPPVAGAEGVGGVAAASPGARCP